MERRAESSIEYVHFGTELYGRTVRDERRLTSGA